MLTLPVAPGLHLTQLHPDDTEELFALTDANRAHLRRWLPWLDITRVSATTAKFIAQTQREATAGTGLHFAIYEQNIIVGNISYVRIDPANRGAYIGYWLAEDAQGRGIMTRAVTALYTYGFAKMDLHRQVILCAEKNTASCAVAERCGFQFEGVSRDAEWLYDAYVSLRVYARLRTDA
jgi:ribosomal-protein-serine acetyltransferase